jgi:predicted Ser/Thr protein kinase
VTDRFELLSQLGRGGMGVVWKARDRETGDIVALKLIHSIYLDDPDYIARFEREVEVARRIDSPHVVKVLGYGRQDSVPYMAMEYVEGQSLREILRQRGPLTWEEARNHIAQTLEGLAAAHAAGVLHRDIKPANLLVDHGGQVKVVDFGISRATDLTRLTGGMTMLGTPTYMAPEGQVDERSELYSVGVVLYELLAGQPPFTGDNMHSIIAKHMRDAPDLSRIPADAREFVGQLLEKDPDDRPASAVQAVQALGSRAHTTPSRAAVHPATSKAEPAVFGTPGGLGAACVAFDSGSLIASFSDGRIVRWDLASGVETSVVANRSFASPLQALAPHSHLIAVGGGEGFRVLVYPHQNGDSIYDAPHNQNGVSVYDAPHERRGDEAAALAFGVGSKLVTGSRAGTLTIVDPMFGGMLRRLSPALPNWCAVAYSLGSPVVAAARRAEIVVWHADSGRVLLKVDSEAAVAQVALSDDGTLLAWTSLPMVVADGLARTRLAHFSSTESTWLPGSRERLLGGEDWRSRLEVWDIRAKRPLARTTVGTAPTFAHRFLHSGAIACSVGDEVALFDSNLREVRRLIGHSGPVTHIAADERGTLLASASVDGTVRVWHL